MIYGYARVSTDGQSVTAQVAALEAAGAVDLLNTLAAITAQGAGFCSLSDTWADTTTPHGRLMVTVIGGLAEFERKLIRTRTIEGRARATQRGQHMGRPARMTPHQQREALARREAGHEALAEIGRSYNVSAATISSLRR